MPTIDEETSKNSLFSTHWKQLAVGIIITGCRSEPRKGTFVNRKKISATEVNVASLKLQIFRVKNV